MSVGELTDRTERPPYVTFETRAIHDVKASTEQGHYVAIDVDYVLVTPPYSKDCFEDKVENWFSKQDVNARNGRQKPEWVDAWKKSYGLWKEGKEIPLDGTPIRGWGALSPAQEKMILQGGIRTIEDLAVCNDEGLRRLGMGGRDLVNKAKSWLQTVNDHGQVALQNAALQKENEQLKITLESLEEKVTILSRHVESLGKAETPQVDAPRETIINAVDILPNAEAAAAIEEYKKPIYESDELKAMYKERFGRRAHPRSTDETLRTKLGL